MILGDFKKITGDHEKFGRKLSQLERYIVCVCELKNTWIDPWIPDHPPRPAQPWIHDTNAEKIKEFFTPNPQNLHVPI